MAVTVSASLVGATTPRMVQIEVNGLTIGDEVTITGSTGPWSWYVRGASPAVASSSQLIRIDNTGAVNAPVVYTVRVDGADYQTAPITVTYDGDYLLTSLDGETVVDFTWLDNADPREIAIDQHFSRVPGRRSTVVRFSEAGGESGEIAARTSFVNSRLLRAELGKSAPMILRTNGDIRDVPAVQVVSVAAAPSQLWAGDGGTSKQRVWSLSWVETEDPYATVAVTNSTVADFNAFILTQGGTVADFNTWMLSQGGTVADFNRFDFASEVA
ncbi:hypothetical protein [Demequina globuliformis]|uniref:hypothetical protein n=1 Tax=Demequina globuliformis TaxID=676202 RepID=UPI000780DEB4|nr:hypothetical protein [Demequina globuliformis]